MKTKFLFIFLSILLTACTQTLSSRMEAMNRVMQENENAMLVARRITDDEQKAVKLQPIRSQEVKPKPMVEKPIAQSIELKKLKHLNQAEIAAVKKEMTNIIVDVKWTELPTQTL